MLSVHFIHGVWWYFTISAEGANKGLSRKMASPLMQWSLTLLSSNLWRAFNISSSKKGDPKKIKWKKYLQHFRKSLSWWSDLLVELFPITGVLLQVATWLCIKSWLYSALLMSTSYPAHLSAIFCYNLWYSNLFKSYQLFSLLSNLFLYSWNKLSRKYPPARPT